MSEILCRWLNSDLRISKHIEPLSLARAFSNGYLIGEILSKHHLQEDFSHFSKLSTANARLNNFTRLEPTLQLLGVPFDLGMARAVMQGQQGAATRLLYQLYILLQKKKRLGLTGAALETMRPAGVSRLQRVEKQIYSERLRSMVKREADVKMQKIAQRFDKRGRDAYGRSVLAEQEREERRRHLQEQMRLQDIQKHRQARRKQQDMMDRIQTAVVQIPKPPTGHIRPRSKQRANHTQNVHLQIAEFERNRKRRSPASSLSIQMNDEQMEEWSGAYVQKIRARLEEDATAREQREKRRRHALIQQLHAHQAHGEMLRDEQLIGRLMRQSQQEQRITVQLMQIRQQKEVLRQNRVLRERQIQDQRIRDYHQTQDQQQALLKQDRISRDDELCKERELHERLLTEHAQSKRLQHFNTCRGILQQILDLATKTGEYRLLTAGEIPLKMLREWRVLFLSGNPLYETEPNIELEKLRLLNQQDYQDYTTMTGEWAWPEEGPNKAPPPNNELLGHMMSVLRKLLNPDVNPKASSSPLSPLRACVLGNTCSGKSSCLTRLRAEHDIHVISVDDLILKVLEAHQAGEPEPENEFGAEVEKILRRGKTVPDDLLINIIIHAIRKVPSGRGWVLDGFPRDVSQARLLEQALGGVGPQQEKNQDKEHEAADRTAPEAPPPASPALRLALMLQVSDERVLQRHRQLQERERLSAPPAGEQSPEQEQILHRVLDFQDSWPELEKWFGEEQNILTKVDAEVDEESLYTKVETLLLEAMNKGQSRRASPSSLSAVETPPTDPDSAPCMYLDEPLPKEIPEYLVPYWDGVCSSYASNVNAALQNLREERNLIIHHLYNIREDYKQYLQKPDLKQEFVSVWQRDYNGVPHDMRHDEETKAELHQRLEDLRERLYDICEKRNEEALQEEAGVTGNGWLEDHTHILVSHYTTLLQVELDRFQDTLHVLSVYYRSVLDPHTNTNQTGPERNDRVSLNASSKQLDEKHLQDLCACAVSTVTNMVSVEVQKLQSEENEELQQQIQRQRENTESQIPANTTNPAKDKKKAGKKKGPPTPVEEPIPAPVEENPEEVQKRAVRNRIRQEYRSVLQQEERGVCARLELLKLQCVATLHSLHSRTELAHRDVEQWSRNRFISETHRIDQMVSVVGHYIETGAQITYELVLGGGVFYVDRDMRVVPAPPPMPRPPPIELTDLDSFNLTVVQLYSLHSELLRIAPTGVMSCSVLGEVLREVSSLGLGSDLVPEAWTRLTDSQIQELVCVLAQDEMVDWRQFLLCAAQPWPRPSRREIIKAYKHFKENDAVGGGVITLQQYLQVDLFQTERLVPDDPADPPSYDRLHHLREFFFTLFAGSSSPPVCDYVTLLLYFCSHPDPAHGFITALSLLTEHTLRYTHTHTCTRSTGLLQSYVHTGDDDDDECTDDEDEGVSVDDVLRAVTHRRIHTPTHSTEQLQQDLVEVFKELGYKVEEEIPFSVLSQHPVLQDLMEESKLYLLIDIPSVLQKQHGDEETSSSTAP